MPAAFHFDGLVPVIPALFHSFVGKGGRNDVPVRHHAMKIVLCC
jgi:hypothetical protein